jgi:hypothetical protein
LKTICHLVVISIPKNEPTDPFQCFHLMVYLKKELEIKEKMGRLLLCFCWPRVRPELPQPRPPMVHMQLPQSSNYVINHHQHRAALAAQFHSGTNRLAMTLRLVGNDVLQVNGAVEPES